MKKLIALMLSVLVIMGICSGCGGSSEGKLDAVKKAGTLVVYTNANFPPFEYMEGSTIMGVDIDIAQAVADELGVELELQNADFDGLVASIASGKGDMCISGMTITEERQKQVDFSKPYVKAVQYLILPEDSDIAVMEDLAGKAIGTPVGYTGQFVIEDEMSVAEDGTEGVLYEKDVDLKTYKSAIEASQDILNGRLDAVIMDELVAQKIANDTDGLKAVQLFYESGDAVEEEYGVAVAKGNEDFLEVINGVIDSLKSEGKIDEFVLTHSSKSIDVEE